MSLTFTNLRNYTKRNIERSLGIREEGERTASMDIEFPGFRHLGLGESRIGFFLTLFLDMRGSTVRAQQLGLQKTNATLHALLPTAARIVDEKNGFIVDYPGDGIMAHWDISDPETRAQGITQAVTCAGWLDDAVKSIVNPLLADYQIPPITCALGMSGGEVIITKVGIPGFTSTKAIGDSVNRAAKLTRAEVQPNGGILIELNVLRGIYFDLTPEVPSDQVSFTYSAGPENSIAVTPRNQLLIPRETRDYARLLRELLEVR